jgi:hypothetical protein
VQRELVPACALQPLNAYFRPHKAPPGERETTARILWQYLHRGVGWSAIVFAIAEVRTVVWATKFACNESQLQYSYCAPQVFLGF